MSEPSPQPNVSAVLVAVLILCVAVLIFLDWKRQGEIDNLHARIDRLPQAAPRPLKAEPHSRERESAPPPPAAPFVQQGDPPPTPAPERALNQDDVITDPLAGVNGGANSFNAHPELNPLIRAVMEAHGEA